MMSPVEVHGKPDAKVFKGSSGGKVARVGVTEGDLAGKAYRCEVCGAIREGRGTSRAVKGGGNEGFAKVNGQVGPGGEESNFVCLDPEVGDGFGKGPKVVRVRGVVKSRGGLEARRDVAARTLAEPTQKRFEIQGEEYGGEGVSLDGPAPDGDSRRRAVRSEEGGGGCSVYLADYVDQIGGVA